jgi:lipid-A-disaccharide synthase
MERDLDLLLSIFPFERRWYARRAPRLRVEFVGHPIFDRYSQRESITDHASRIAADEAPPPPTLLLLPGSRAGELRRHLPVMLDAAARVEAKHAGVQIEIVLADENLLHQAQALGLPSRLRVQVGDLPGALRRATVALSKTGTITLECAYFGVPTVTLYKTSWPTYYAAKQVVSVPWLSMPNLLANQAVFPEFVQADATPENLAAAVLGLLDDAARRRRVRAVLARVVASLGSGGTSLRAAAAVADLLGIHRP